MDTSTPVTVPDTTVPFLSSMVTDSLFNFIKNLVLVGVFFICVMKMERVIRQKEWKIEKQWTVNHANRVTIRVGYEDHADVINISAPAAKENAIIREGKGAHGRQCPCTI